jgi:hypothetical protein
MQHFKFWITWEKDALRERVREREREREVVVPHLFVTVPVRIQRTQSCNIFRMVDASSMNFVRWTHEILFNLCWRDAILECCDLGDDVYGSAD